MSVRHNNAPAGPGATVAVGATPLHPGDLIRWHGRMASVTDVADFHRGGVYVLLEFINHRRRPPLSVSLDRLDGAEVWHGTAASAAHRC